MRGLRRRWAPLMGATGKSKSEKYDMKSIRTTKRNEGYTDNHYNITRGGGLKGRSGASRHCLSDSKELLSRSGVFAKCTLNLHGIIALSELWERMRGKALPASFSSKSHADESAGIVSILNRPPSPPAIYGARWSDSFLANRARWNHCQGAEPTGARVSTPSPVLVKNTYLHIQLPMVELLLALTAKVMIS